MDQVGNELSDENEEQCVADGEDDLPPPTLPQDVSIELRGFASEDDATALGNAIIGALRVISSFINLERLDGVTVAFDYDEALSLVDRGLDGLRPLSRSDGEVIGVAMSPAVLRDGAVKVHLVFSASYILGLMDEDGESDDYRLALAIIAHECAHVEVTKHLDEAFPDTVLQARYEDFEAAIFGQAAEVFWEEYAACRAAAIFSSGKSSDYADGLRSVLRVARERSNAAIRAYRTHASVDTVIAEAGPPLCEPLKLAAYLLGQFDGSNSNWEAEQETRDLVEATDYASAIDAMHGHLRTLWDTRALWKSREEFSPLRGVVREAFARGGLNFEPLPDGRSYVRIPFTPETLPI